MTEGRIDMLSPTGARVTVPFGPQFPPLAGREAKGWTVAPPVEASKPEPGLITVSGTPPIPPAQPTIPAAAQDDVAPAT